MRQLDGVLAPGIHKLTWTQFLSLMVEEFPESRSRPRLAAGLRRALDLLREAGVRRVVIAGSMVGDKHEPGDCDGWFDITLAAWGTDGERFVRELRRLDPDCHWSWDPNDRIKDTTGKPRTPQWVRYGVDLYPQIIDIEPEIMVGADGYPRQFPEEFFQFARDGSRQGVVEIVEDT